MRTIYLKTGWSLEDRRGLRGRRLAKHLKDEGDLLLAHKVTTGDERSTAPVDVREDILTPSMVADFAPDLVVLEGGLFTGWGEEADPRIPLEIMVDMAKQGTSFIVADVDFPLAIDQYSSYAQAGSVLGGVPDYNGRANPRYGSDEVSYRWSHRSVVCFPERMIISKWLEPTFDGIEAILASSPIQIRTWAPILASGNADTSDVLDSDTFVDRRHPFPFASVKQHGEGFIALIGAGVTHDRIVEEFPDNARWLSNVAQFLIAETARERELFGATGRRAAPPKPALSELVNKGEGPTLELKSTFRVNLHTGKHDKRMVAEVVEAVAGFCNAVGGVLVVGVADDGLPVGLSPDFASYQPAGDWERLQRDIINSIRTELGVGVAASISVDLEALGGVDVVRIDVPRSNEPAWVGDDLLCVRMQNTTQRLKGKDAQEYLRTRFSSR